jgi:hypothetical protein
MRPTILKSFEFHLRGQFGGKIAHPKYEGKQLAESVLDTASAILPAACADNGACWK